MSDDKKYVIREKEPGVLERVWREFVGEDPDRKEYEIRDADTGNTVGTIREKEPGLWDSIRADVTGEERPREKEIVD